MVRVYENGTNRSGRLNDVGQDGSARLKYQNTNTGVHKFKVHPNSFHRITGCSLLCTLSIL